MLQVTTTTARCTNGRLRKLVRSGCCTLLCTGSAGYRMSSTVVVLDRGGRGRGRTMRVTSRRGKECSGVVVRCRGAWTRGVMRTPVVVAVRVAGMPVPDVLHGVPSMVHLGGGGEQRLVDALCCSTADAVLPVLGGLGRVVWAQHIDADVAPVRRPDRIIISIRISLHITDSRARSHRCSTVMGSFHRSVHTGTAGFVGEVVLRVASSQRRQLE